MTIFSINFETIASNDYYYYHQGEKFYLTPLNNLYSVVYLNNNNVLSQVTSNNVDIVTEIFEDEDVIQIIKNSKSSTSLINNPSNDLSTKHILPCFVDKKGKTIIPTHYIDIKLKDENDITPLETVLEKYSLKYVSNNKYLKAWHTVKITPNTGYTSIDLANILHETGFFEYAIPDLNVPLDYCISYDPLVSEQWYLYNGIYNSASEKTGYDISACDAWNYATGRGVKVAVFDSPIDITHEDLITNISTNLSYNTETGQSPASFYDTSLPPSGSATPASLRHGTCVAGVLAAIRNNNKFISGVAPDATIVPISTDYTSVSSQSTQKRSNGIIWAAENGVSIINCSWTTSIPHVLLTEAISYAARNGRNGKGCIIVFSAGNEHLEQANYPSNSPYVISVGALNKYGTESANSNYGSQINVWAPGEDIKMIQPDNGDYENSGTSFAAPIVSGIAAMLLQLNPNLTREEVTSLICSEKHINAYNIIQNYFEQYSSLPF